MVAINGCFGRINKETPSVIICIVIVHGRPGDIFIFQGITVLLILLVHCREGVLTDSEGFDRGFLYGEFLFQDDFNRFRGKSEAFREKSCLVC